MHDNLFDKVNIKPENTHLPDGTNLDSEEEAARYEALVQSLGTVDLQLLGLGRNGHIGFNEPGDSFVEPTHCVDCLLYTSIVVVSMILLCLRR